MDNRRFDDLTRSIGRATSRRQVLKGLLGGLAAAMLPGLKAKQAAAAPLAPIAQPPPCDAASQAKCDENAQQFYELQEKICHDHYGGRQGNPYALTICLLEVRAYRSVIFAPCRRIVPCNSAACQHCTDSGCQSFCVGSATCNGRGSCVCPNGEPVCHDACPDYQSDATNCGTCDHHCPAGSACVAGTCCVDAGGTCTVTSDCCFGECSNGHCCLPDGGFCGNANECCSGFCGGDGKCFSCTPLGETCTATSQCCTGSCINGTCETCAGLNESCSGNTQCCSGMCVSGACASCVPEGQACASGTTCCAGTCTNGTCQCPSGQKLCNDGSCADCCTSNDCSSGDTCQNGVCAPQSSTCFSGPNGKCDQAEQCACEYDYAGSVLCIQIINNCYGSNDCPPCSTTSDCGEGEVCAVTNDGTTLGCVRNCQG